MNFFKKVLCLSILSFLVTGCSLFGPSQDEKKWCQDRSCDMGMYPFGDELGGGYIDFRGYSEDDIYYGPIVIDYDTYNYCRK